MKAILDQGWYSVKVRLESKLKIKGGQLIEVPPQYTSQKCRPYGERKPPDSG
jgi:putative transposase